MPPKYVRRRRYGRRRKGRKLYKNYRAKGAKFSRNRTFSYKQIVSGLQINAIGARFFGQTAANQNLALEFRAVDMPQWGTFSSLYDQYCITKIVFKLIPMLNMNGVQPLNGTAVGVSALNPGILATVIDTDDAGALTNLTEYQQYESCQIRPVIQNRTITRVLVPGIREYAISTGGGSNAASLKKRVWLDCANSNISHYGLKIYLDAGYSANMYQQYQVWAAYYVKFRSVR